MSWYVYIVVYVAIILVEAYMLMFLWKVFIVSNARRIEFEYPDLSHGLRGADNSLLVRVPRAPKGSEGICDAAANKVATNAEKGAEKGAKRRTETRTENRTKRRTEKRTEKRSGAAAKHASRNMSAAQLSRHL